MVIARYCALTARPAELIFAEDARHVVTPFVLLDSSAAHGTKGDSFFVLFNPLLQILVHSLGARNLYPMPQLTTLEADFCLALGALQLDRILVLSSHMLVAVWLRAVPHQGITIEVFLGFESLKFFQKLASVALSQYLAQFFD